jgi:hypothetical protein
MLQMPRCVHLESYAIENHHDVLNLQLWAHFASLGSRPNV